MKPATGRTTGTVRRDEPAIEHGRTGAEPHRSTFERPGERIDTAPRSGRTRRPTSERAARPRTERDELAPLIVLVPHQVPPTWRPQHRQPTAGHRDVAVRQARPNRALEAALANNLYIVRHSSDLAAAEVALESVMLLMAQDPLSRADIAACDFSERGPTPVRGKAPGAMRQERSAHDVAAREAMHQPRAGVAHDEYSANAADPDQRTSDPVSDTRVRSDTNISDQGPDRVDHGDRTESPVRGYDDGNGRGSDHSGTDYGLREATRTDTSVHVSAADAVVHSSLVLTYDPSLDPARIVAAPAPTMAGSAVSRTPTPERAIAPIASVSDTLTTRWIAASQTVTPNVAGQQTSTPTDRQVVAAPVTPSVSPKSGSTVSARAPLSGSEDPADRFRQDRPTTPRSAKPTDAEAARAYRPLLGRPTADADRTRTGDHDRVEASSEGESHGQGRHDGSQGEHGQRDDGHDQHDGPAVTFAQ